MYSETCVIRPPHGEDHIGLKSQVQAYEGNFWGENVYTTCIHKEDLYNDMSIA